MNDSPKTGGVIGILGGGQLARMLSVWGRIIPLSETIKRIEEVTLLDLRGFAEKTFSSSNPALALYGPIKKAPGLEELRDRLAS